MTNFLTDKEFTLFKDLIYNHSGIHFTSTNRAILESRLRNRIQTTDTESPQKYYNFLLTDEEELKYLLDSVTTNLTRFFRNVGHFEAFEKFVVPEVISNKTRDKDYIFRIWSAGCATGEEPYTIAMVMRECLPAYMKIEIIGSDLSLKSLMTAKSGFYPPERVKDVPEKYLAKYFEKKTDGYQIRDDIMQLIQFDYHNLKYDSGLRNIDVIFCRNVIIYFDAEAQRNVINRFWNAMREYSYLFIGHSESLFGMNTQFQFVKTEWTTLYKKQMK